MEIGISPEDAARNIADPEICDLPFGTVLALLESPIGQTPQKTDFHHASLWTVHGNRIGYLEEFAGVRDLSSNERIRDRQGRV